MILAAFLLDLLVGDPRWMIHPVQVMGWLISSLERFLRQVLAPLIGLKAAGGVLTLFMVFLVYIGTAKFLAWAYLFNYWLGWFFSCWLLSTTIAAKGLYQAAKQIFTLLRDQDLTKAREQVAFIVGRDTEQLSVPEIIRAVVETVAENTVDGIISPLFFAFIGGVPLAMAYRAINTLDSMVGYRNEKYLQFGWASARLDDLANYLPARLTAIIILLVAAGRGENWRAGWQAVKQDAPRHPSPNSGYPEAATAGVLGIRLGGLNYYQGQASRRAYMGSATRELEMADIQRTWQIMWGVTGLGIIFGYCFLALVNISLH